VWLKPIVLATWEVDSGKIMVLDQSRQKARETPISTNNPDVVVCMSVIPAMQKL
jgi:hypothetical protein